MFRTSPFLVLAFLMNALPASAQEAAHIPGQLLVMMAQGRTPEHVVRDLATVEGAPTGLHVVEALSAPMRCWLLRFDHASVPQPVMLRAILSHPDVLLAQNDHLIEDRSVPDDPQYPDQWHHEKVASEGAWAFSTGGLTATGDTIVVCIIERVDLPHPDLAGNAWMNHAEIPGNGIDDDGNGYVDDHRGWNPGANNDDVYGGSHGTQVAGMAGAKGDNGIGVTGANWNVKLMVVNHGGVSESQVVAAYTYPLVMRRRYNASGGTEGGFVVATNASWGINGGQPSNSPIWCAMYDTLGTAGILNCGATANSNVDVDVVGDLPTACPSDYMVGVTATNSNDMRTNSAYGLNSIDVAAPGNSVLTTSIGGGYGLANGTSFASPLTAGVIGLLYGAPCPALMELVHADPQAGALYIRQMLFDGVDPVGNLPGTIATGGRINAANSMQLIMAACGSCVPPFNLQAYNTAIGTAILAWNAIPADTYTLRYRPVGSGTWTEVEAITSTSQTVTDLLACTVHEFQVASICGGEESAPSSTYVWTSEGCCHHPGAPQLLAHDEGSLEVAWGDVLAATAFDLRWRASGTEDWNEVSGIMSGSHTLYGLAACTGHELQARSICGGEVSPWSPTALFFTTDCGACVDLIYCPSASANSFTEWIDRVRIGTIDHTSGNDGGYGDHTGLSTELPIGAPIPFILTPGYAFFPFAQWFRIWMDLDRDGSFTGADELVFDASGTVNTDLAADLTVPIGTEPGPVRIRIAMKYQSAVPTGCTNGYDFGETEDYCANLSPFDAIGEQGGVTGGGAWVFVDQAGQLAHFHSRHAHPGAVAEVLVMDHGGRLLLRGMMRDGRAVIPVHDLAAGAYVFRIRSAPGQLAHGRFVLTR
ncbi:MAG: S8 family serine peptidase [Flavobacteriales bacterium]|nr:S8 family serine peptidase [Flavobacteriales bacterium]